MNMAGLIWNLQKWVGVFTAGENWTCEGLSRIQKKLPGASFSRRLSSCRSEADDLWEDKNTNKQNFISGYERAETKFKVWVEFCSIWETNCQGANTNITRRTADR